MPSDQAELARALFEEIGDALFLLDPDADRLIDVNPTALRLTGFARSELLRFPATHLFRLEAAGGVQRLRGAFTKTVVFHGQDGFLLRTKQDAAWVPVSLTVSRLHVAPKTLALIIARDDRERRSALAQAQRVEAELRTVLANSPAAHWSAERAPGPDVLLGWQFRYVSPLLARIAARPAGFFDHPLKWAEAVHPADRDGYRSRLRKLLTGAQADAEGVYRVLTPNGTMRWVRDRLQVVRDGAGRPVRLDGCVADVTEQRLADDAVRQNEQRFRALVEKSHDGIMLLDARGRIKYVSPAVRAISGHDPDDLVGTDGFDLIHPDDRAAGANVLAQVLAHPGESLTWACRGLTATGGVQLIETTACNRLDDPAVQAIVLNYRDVTERERSAQELARQHALLEGLFASVPDVVCYKDRDLRFLGGNPAFAELAGRPMAELLGKTCREVFADEWAARVREAEVGVLTTGQTAGGRDWVTYPGGRKALLDIVISPLRGNDGDILGLILVGRDVTDRDRLEEQLRQSQKMDAIGRLAGGIAHDFNNLLTVVLGSLELLRSGTATADPPELLAAAERAARHAADLTRQMLGFARRQPVRAATVNLDELVREVIGLLRRSIDPRVAIRFSPAAGLPPLAADPTQLQQVLMNLCLNARDAMPQGGTVTIETAAAESLRPPGAPAGGTAPGRFVRLSVADTGFGMAEEVRARLFEPFFTTKEVGKGTGLGLAVVYGIVTAHGGWVECASEPGAGSRFDVYLPNAPHVEHEMGETATVTPAPARGRGETVLVADDESGVRELARAALTMHGYRVLTAQDGAEAVEVFRREADRIGVVVLDATMPRMSGRQAFDAIRAMAPAVPVLFASGYPAGEFLPEQPYPNTAFLNKPYTPVELANEVRRLLDARGGT